MTVPYEIDSFNRATPYTAAALQQNGKLVAVGWASANSTSMCGTYISGLLVSRYTPDGIPDDTFGDQGHATFGNTTPQDVAVQADGKIVTAGGESRFFQTVRLFGDEDLCPDDPLKMEPGACGCGIPDTDSDGDGVPDCNQAGSGGEGGCFISGLVR